MDKSDFFQVRSLPEIDIGYWSWHSGLAEQLCINHKWCSQTLESRLTPMAPVRAITWQNQFYFLQSSFLSVASFASYVDCITKLQCGRFSCGKYHKVTPKKKKYFKAPYCSFSLSQTQDSIQYLEGPNGIWKDHDRHIFCPDGPQYACHGASRFHLVLPGTEQSPLFMTI